MSERSNKTSQKIFNTLIERFGEPIDKVTPTVGISDDRSGKVTTKGESDNDDEDEDLLLDENQIKDRDNYFQWIRSVADVLKMRPKDVNCTEARRAYYSGVRILEYVDSHNIQAKI